MASVETFRPGAPGADAAEAAPRPIDLAAFQGSPEADRLTGLVAFALAAERQADAEPETVARLRQEADVALTEHAFRTLHNNVERLQQEAVREQLGHLPRPPGFLRLLAANLLALVLVAAAAGWLALHPQTLAGITGLLAG
ncbi:hypothetical protein QWZ14_12790 [Paeniroseomonas aquatica]|jgi:hypothetical protein|uniref:Uncharacterized protein n=1 Tax=Paeniroseomonas aquatica TaxID=373043 RepID=A0ABT8A6B7_9PROT|nr:hypothetical protein [Paeniroseomonas aquatica]MDN3565240.1 hypothetical protein [Paeniroseomonas aquatica]